MFGVAKRCPLFSAFCLVTLMPVYLLSGCLPFGSRECGVRSLRIYVCVCMCDTTFVGELKLICVVWVAYY